MSDVSNPIQIYSSYLYDICPNVDYLVVSQSLSYIKQTQWEAPETFSDYNNIAVIALANSEKCENLLLRELYVQTALDALQTSINIESNPIALAHLSFLMTMTGNNQQGISYALAAWLNITTQEVPEQPNYQLLYLPPIKSVFTNDRCQLISSLLSSLDSKLQQLCLLGEALCFSSMFFYSQTGIRWLQLALQLLPHSPRLNYKLGIALGNCLRWESFFYLNRVREFLPQNIQVIHALYLSSLDIGNRGEAERLLNLGHQLLENSELNQWTNLTCDSFFTYISYDVDIVLAVEASLKSIVTSVLLAEGDWFEYEMEFWRSWIQPGMTVIDVGANVGVYTFSAAKRVGSTGRVLAIEPFSGCIRCLQETRRINQFHWVTLCHGAASDRQGKIYLTLRANNELNEVSTERPVNEPVEDVPCFTLDYLFTNEDLENVDLLKIDAEGHELQVLLGGKTIIEKFSPVILYENIVGSHNSNQSVAEYLITLGYQLFTYRPFVQEMVSVEDFQEINSCLNIIAKRDLTNKH